MFHNNLIPIFSLRAVPARFQPFRNDFYQANSEPVRNFYFFGLGFEPPLALLPVAFVDPPCALAVLLPAPAAPFSFADLEAPALAVLRLGAAASEGAAPSSVAFGRLGARAGSSGAVKRWPSNATSVMRTAVKS